MTTQYEVTGFDRPAALYEFANAHGIHAGSMDKLVRFAIEIQRLAVAHTTTKEEKEEAA
jgi:hypothetical protein